MATSDSSFETDKISAASLFVQTMIVVDDEAAQVAFETSSEPVVKLQAPPSRRVATKAKANLRKQAKVKRKSENPLDAKKLIEAALDLGIICSVLRAQPDSNLVKRITKAASKVDILTLDWEMPNGDLASDDGETALKIIKSVVASDNAINGRIRLIAIYTASLSRTRILASIKKELNKRSSAKYSGDSEFVTDGQGLRIVCYYKSSGINRRPSAINYIVDESSLPEVLLKEFSCLSNSLLSNVALATVAGIRDVTHHVINTFESKMDAPYFHHRGKLVLPEEAESYAIDVIFSEIKKAVSRKKIKGFANTDAIHRRIDDILSGDNHSMFIGNNPISEIETISKKDIKSLIVNGEIYTMKGSHEITGYSIKKRKSAWPGLSSIFNDDINEAIKNLNQFAFLTQTSNHPKSHRVLMGDELPSLSLGSIVKPHKGDFLICLQASCDSARKKVSGPFIFAPLTVIDKPLGRPVFVIEYSGSLKILQLEDDTYTRLLSREFKPNLGTQTVIARAYTTSKSLFFVDSNDKKYRWIADIKRRRALRAVQAVAQHMGRIGFDEFEPFRAQE